MLGEHVLRYSAHLSEQYRSSLSLTWNTSQIVLRQAPKGDYLVTYLPHPHTTCMPI